MKLVKAASLALPVMLFGCGGGGGSSAPSGGSTSGSTFASWTSVNSNVLNYADAIFETLPFSYSPSATSITALNPISSPEFSGTSEFTKDGSTNINSLSIQSSTQQPLNIPFGSVTSGVLGINSNVQYLIKNGPTNVAYLSNPFASVYNYQMSGVWYTLDGISNGTAGAFSTGKRSTQDQLPGNGTKVYLGTATGFYSNQSGDISLLVADATVTVDFASQSATIQIANTFKVTSPTTSTGFRSIDFTSTYPIQSLSSSSGSSINISSLTAYPTALQFYGPSANEIGALISYPRTSGLWMYMFAISGKT